MECKHCKIEMDYLPLSSAWRCNKCGRIVKVNEIGKLENEIKNMFPILNSKNKVSDSRRIELLELIDEMRKDFPKLTVGQFSKLSDGTINDYWAKEVLDWFERWLKKRVK